MTEYESAFARLIFYWATLHHDWWHLPKWSLQFSIFSQNIQWFLTCPPKSSKSHLISTKKQSYQCQITTCPVFFKPEHAVDLHYGLILLNYSPSPHPQILNITDQEYIGMSNSQPRGLDSSCERNFQISFLVSMGGKPKKCELIVRYKLVYVRYDYFRRIHSSTKGYLILIQKTSRSPGGIIDVWQPVCWHSDHQFLN